jgi:site-specific recombinase XerD
MPAVSFEESLRDLEGRLAAQGGRGRRLSPRSQAAYLKDARRVAAWLEEQGVAGPAAVTPSAIEAAFRGLGWSPASRARATTALREWLAPYHPPSRAPVDLIERPRPTPPPVPRLSQRDAAALVDGAGRAATAGPVAEALALRDRALVEVLYGSGLRRQEACDLVLAGLDFEHEALRVVGKGGRVRTVPLTEPAVAALRAWLALGRPRLVAGRAPQAATRAPVFVSRSGRALDGSAVYRVVARELRAAGRAGGPHLLRHAAGTHLLEGPGGRDGAHLRVVQEVLGHASLATTQRYTGVTTKAMQAALRRGHPRG